VEEELARRRDVRAPFKAVLEYGAGIDKGQRAELIVVDADDEVSLWLEADGKLAAAARVQCTV
jgi:hypothetical protein